MKVLTIQRLEVFRAVYETGSVTEAAMRLGLTQPTVSRNLSNFQYALQFDLFAKQKGRLRPTPEGEALYLKCKGTFEQLDRLDQSIHEIKHGSEQVLRIMLLAAGAQLPFLADVIKRLRDKWPQVKIQVSQGGGDEQLECLRAGEIDIGFGTLRSPSSDIDSCFMESFKMIGILPHNHPLANRSMLSLADFTNFPSVLPARDTLLGQMIWQTFEAQEIKPESSINVRAPNQLPDLIQSLGYIGVVDMVTAFHSPRMDDLRVLPLDREITVNVHANWMHGRPLGKPAHYLIQELKHQLSREKQKLEGCVANLV